MHFAIFHMKLSLLGWTTYSDTYLLPTRGRHIRSFFTHSPFSRSRPSWTEQRARRHGAATGIQIVKKWIFGWPITNSKWRRQKTFYCDLKCNIRSNKGRWESGRRSLYPELITRNGPARGQCFASRRQERMRCVNSLKRFSMHVNSPWTSIRSWATPFWIVGCVLGPLHTISELAFRKDSWNRRAEAPPDRKYKTGNMDEKV